MPTKSIFMALSFLVLGACASSSSSPAESSSASSAQAVDSGSDGQATDGGSDGATYLCSRTTPVPTFDLGVRCGDTLEQSQLSVSSMCSKQGSPFSTLAGACGSLEAVALVGRDTQVTCFHERSSGRLVGAEATDYAGKKFCFAAVDGFVPPVGCFAAAKPVTCGQ